MMNSLSESKEYSAMSIKELCYLFDMSKEGYDPATDVEAILYDIEYGDTSIIKVSGACVDNKSEYLISYDLGKSRPQYKVGYSRDHGMVYCSCYLPMREDLKDQNYWTAGSAFEEGENSLERIACLAILEWCACKVWGNE